MQVSDREHDHPLVAELTIDGRATHQMRVGEVQRRVQPEVGLQHLADFLTEVEEHTSALQRNLSLLAELRNIKTQYNDQHATSQAFYTQREVCV